MNMFRRRVVQTLLALIAISGAGAFASTKEHKQMKQELDYTKTPNRYVEIQGIRYAYRTIGNENGNLPLVLFQHFTGTMDDWDSELIDGLAKNRKLYIFDNAGVGASGGASADSVAAMAAIGEAFLDALNLKRVDVLGYSLGGFIVQQILLDRPELIRKAILAGTAQEGGDGVASQQQILQDATKKSAETKRQLKDVLFFTDTAEGQAAALSFLRRINNHSVDAEKPLSPESTRAQLKAIVLWGSGPSNLARLEAVKQPVLIVNGSNDIMTPTSNSLLLFQHISTSQLSLYPDSGHGSIFQYHGLFVSQVNTFLDGVK